MDSVLLCEQEAVKPTVPLGVGAAKIGNICKEVKQLERGALHFDLYEKWREHKTHEMRDAYT